MHGPGRVVLLCRLNPGTRIGNSGIHREIVAHSPGSTDSGAGTITSVPEHASRTAQSMQQDEARIEWIYKKSPL